MASERYRITRYKIDNLDKGVHKLVLWKHYLKQNKELCTKTIISSDSCGKGVYLKYLASDGKYKFMFFEKSVTFSGESTSNGNGIGLPNSLVSSVSPTYSLGYSSVRTLQVSTTVDLEKYKILADIVSSPKVYLQTKEETYNINDEEENWIEVQVSGNNSIPLKKGISTFSLLVTLPEYNSIKL